MNREEIIKFLKEKIKVGYGCKEISIKSNELEDILISIINITRLNYISIIRKKYKLSNKNSLYPVKYKLNIRPIEGVYTEDIEDLKDISNVRIEIKPYFSIVSCEKIGIKEIEYENIDGENVSLFSIGNKEVKSLLNKLEHMQGIEYDDLYIDIVERFLNYLFETDSITYSGWADKEGKYWKYEVCYEMNDEIYIKYCSIEIEKKIKDFIIQNNEDDKRVYNIIGFKLEDKCYLKLDLYMDLDKFIKISKDLADKDESLDESDYDERINYEFNVLSDKKMKELKEIINVEVEIYE